MTHGIKSYFGGLGDTLQFSTLPEMFYEKGDEVFLTDDAPFRNKNTRSLIWDLNPYVKGQLNTPWTLGDIPNRIYENKCNDFIKNWEHIHGLEPRNSFPKIYYIPKNDISNIETLVDLGTQVTNVNIHDVAAWLEIHVPNVLT